MSLPPTMTLFQVIERLVGPTDPVGCSWQDEDRLESVRSYASIAEDIVGALLELRRYKDSREDSVAKIGKRAARAIEEIAEMVRDDEPKAMTADRTRKLFRKRMWALLFGSGGCATYSNKAIALDSAETYFRDARVIPVLVSELPKPSPRKKVRRGK